MPVAVPPSAPDRSRGRGGRSGHDGRPGRRPSVPPLRPAAVAGLALLLALASLREPVTEAATADAASPDSAIPAPITVPAGGGRAARPAAGSFGPPGMTDGAAHLQPVSADDALLSAALADDDSASLDEAEVGALALRLAGRWAGQITGGFIVQPFAAALDARPRALPVVDTVLGDDQEQER